MAVTNHHKPRCIVLPFQDPDSPGMGLALHFLLGNVLAVHIGFKECWFGWRTAKLFLKPDSLRQYCQGRARELDLQRISAAQDVQCWMHGRVDADTVALRFFDARAEAFREPENCTITLNDHLVGFRQCALNLLDRRGYPMLEHRWPMGLWPEIISPEGLRMVGRALEAFYFHSAYGDRSAIDLAPFAAAVVAAPESFMAHDLLGWAHYRRQDRVGAKASFLRALALNPDAIGPMAGLMGSAILEKDRDSALYWAARKAQTRAEDVTAAVEKTRNKLQP